MIVGNKNISITNMRLRMKSIGILVCDDQETIHSEVNDLLENLAEQVGYTFDIYHCYNAEELINFSHDYDILLLDIDMPGKDGIEAAGQIINDGAQKQIIMLSSKQERFKDAFKIGAKRFVTKPIYKNEFNEALSNSIYSLAGNEFVKVNYKGKKCKITERTIKYIEVKGDFLKIYTENHIFNVNESLKSLFGRLDKRIFLEVHRSYVVNLLWMTDINKKYIKLKGEIEIPISRRKSKEVLQSVINFDKTQE